MESVQPILVVSRVDVTAILRIDMSRKAAQCAPASPHSRDPDVELRKARSPARVPPDARRTIVGNRIAVVIEAGRDVVGSGAGDDENRRDPPRPTLPLAHTHQAEPVTPVEIG